MIGRVGQNENCGARQVTGHFICMPMPKIREPMPNGDEIIIFMFTSNQIIFILKFQTRIQYFGVQ